MNVATNPIGVPVDLDGLTAAFLEGELIAVLLEQPSLQDGQLEALITAITEAHQHISV